MQLGELEKESERNGDNNVASLKKSRSPRWRHRSFLTLLPLRRKTTIQEQNTSERIQEHGTEAEALSLQYREKRDHIRRVGEAAAN